VTRIDVTVIGDSAKRYIEVEGLMEKRRGRPPKPEAERLQPVCTNLPGPEFEAYCEAARVSRKPLAELVREVLARAARREFPQLINRESRSAS
jgi:hypothetical protein